MLGSHGFDHAVCYDVGRKYLQLPVECGRFETEVFRLVYVGEVSSCIGCTDSWTSELSVSFSSLFRIQNITRLCESQVMYI